MVEKQPEQTPSAGVGVRTISMEELKKQIQLALSGKSSGDELSKYIEPLLEEEAKELQPSALGAVSEDKIERMKTGIKGFDELITGGIPRGSIILVVGGPGSGKTIFATQFLVNGAVEYNERGAYISFEEPLESIRKSGKLFGWNIKELEKNNSLYIFSCDPYEIRSFAKSFGGQLYYFIREADVKRIVFDSITYLTIAEEGRLEFRKEIAKLSKRLKTLNVTSVFISEVSESEAEEVGSGMEEFVADGVVHLHNIRVGDRRERAVEILKMRHTKHDTYLHPFIISSKGIEVFPREQVFSST